MRASWDSRRSWDSAVSPRHWGSAVRPRRTKQQRPPDGGLPNERSESYDGAQPASRTKTRWSESYTAATPSLSAEGTALADGAAAGFWRGIGSSLTGRGGLTR
jgi:hypothetical protein